MNPLTDIKFKVPFDQVKATDVEPAIDELLADANRRVETAVADPNPLKAIDTMTERLDYALSVVRHIWRASRPRRNFAPRSMPCSPRPARSIRASL